MRVPRLKAAISYWGSVGLISKGPFDEWLERRIDNRCYTDLRSFADYLAAEMNRAAGDKPLGNDQQVGVHVAGFQHWEDDIRRPTFYHIHNGHSHIVWKYMGRTVDGQTILEKSIPTWVISPRELFARHDNFSPESQKTPDEVLTAGHLTMNGDFAGFHIILEHLKLLMAHLNTIQGFSIPRKPNELGPRLGFLKTLIEITIGIYKCSSMPRSIGGEVLALGIREDGRYV